MATTTRTKRVPNYLIRSTLSSSSKQWTVLIVAITLGVVVIALVIAAAIILPDYKAQQNLKRAEASFAKEEWSRARNDYEWYLRKNLDDEVALTNYAYASHRVIRDRRSTLGKVGKAYFQLAVLNPEDEEARKRLIDFYHKNKFWSDLAHVTGYFRRDDPDDPDLLYYEAIALDRLGRSADAIERYRNLIENDYRVREQYGNLARLLYNQSLNELAGDVFEKALGVHPGNANIYRQRAWFYIETNLPDLAKQDTQMALTLSEDDPKILVLGAHHAITEMDFELAVSYSEKALAIDPELSEPYLNLVYAYERLGQNAAAVKLLENLDPYFFADNPNFYLVLAELQISTKKFDDFNKTLETYRGAYTNKLEVFAYLEARELIAKDQIIPAISKLSTVVKSAPRFYRAQFYLAMTYLDENQIDLAQTALESYLRHRPSDQRALTIWQQFFGGPPSPEQSQKSARDLLGIETAIAGDYVRAARTLRRSNQNESADNATNELVRQLLDQAIRLDPQLPLAYQTMAELLIGENSLQDAHNIIQSAEQAGVPSTEFTTLRAAIFLQEDNVDAAYNLLENDFNGTDINRSSIQTWVNIFASRGHLDIALNALDLAAKNTAIEDDRTVFKIDRATLCRTYDEPERALILVRALEPTLQDRTLLRDRLDQEKLALAQKLIEDGLHQDHQTAEELINEIQSRAPEDPRLYIARARIRLTQETPGYEEAEEFCLTALQYDPQDPDAPILLYELAARKGQLERSLEFARRAVGARPKNRIAQIAQVNALMRLQLFTEAGTAVESLLITYPSDTTILELAAKAYANAGQVNRANGLLDRLEVLADDNPETNNTLTAMRGLLSTQQGKWDEAEVILRSQYLANPKNFATLKALFRAVYFQGRTHDALQLLQQFAKDNPDHPESWTLLGQFHTLSKTKSGFLEAASAFTQALFVMEDYAPALRGLIEVQYSLNNQGVALALCEQYLSDQPDDLSVLYRKALVLSQNASKLDEALSTIEHAVDISERLEFVSLRGGLYLELERYDEAIEDFRHVADIQGQTTIQQDIAMVIAYIGLPQIDMARRYFDIAQSKSENVSLAVQKILADLAKQLDEIEGKI